MDDRTLENLIQKMLSFGDKNEVRFCWHGGEPLLAGIDFYKKIILLQNSCNLRGRKIRNSIQTNGTLLNEKWADFLVDNNFSVGISLDGPKDIQNANRPSISGSGSFDLVMDGLKLLQDRGNYPSVISVTTSNSLGNSKRIFDFFIENGVNKFLPKDFCEFSSSGKLLPFAITPEEYVDFLIEMFECWMSKDSSNIEIVNLYQIIKGIVGGRPNLCEYSGRCNLFVTIGSDGTIGPCDNFPIKNYSIGNINNVSSIDVFFRTADYKRFCGDICFARSNCHHCEWYKNVCGGGCMRDSCFSQNAVLGSAFCDAKRRLFGYVKKRVLEIQSC